MTPIPLGLLYPKQNLNLDSPEFYNIDFNKKEHTVLCRHRTRDGSGQWIDRKIIDNLCKTKWSSFVKFIDYEISNKDFIKELKKSKFCLCIHGGGFDPCPKFFECILNGCIPIIQHSPLDEVFNKFPIIYINDLQENSLSVEFLTAKLEELKEFYINNLKRKEILKLLTMDYWWDLINEKLIN
jgi:hypothetical protein